MDLIGGREVKDMLGVSRQRAHVVMNRRDFPHPVGTVNGRNKVWSRADVVAWMDEHRYDIVPAARP